MTQWRTIAGASAGLLAVAVAGSGASAAPLHPVAHAAAVTESRLRTPAQGTTDYFGYASAASGTTVVVGSFGHKDGANADEGAVYVYTRPSHGWSSLRPTATLTPPDGAANDEFGEAVAISGRTIVVGAHQHKSSQGAVYVYIEPKHGWKTTSHAAAELTASGPPTATSSDPRWGSPERPSSLVRAAGP
jgi:hypothetical protein